MPKLVTWIYHIVCVISDLKYLYDFGFCVKLLEFNEWLNNVQACISKNKNIKHK